MSNTLSTIKNGEGELHQFGEGYSYAMKASISDNEINVAFDLEGMTAHRVAQAACKDWLTDLSNNTRATLKRETESAAKDGTEAPTFEDVLSRYAAKDEHGIWRVNVYDTMTKTRRAAVATKKVTAEQAADMLVKDPKKLSAEQRAALLAALLAADEAK